MVRIISPCCDNNLNYKNVVEDILGDDITNEITINTSPIVLLSSVNLSRKIVKIYVAQLSNSLAGVWVRHGTNINTSNASFAVPLKNLYINTSQASRPLSVMCSDGTAVLRLTVINKI